MPLISRVIVPSLYEVFLHEEDYHAQEPMFRIMREEAAIHLTAELERLNASPSRLPSLLKSLVGVESPNLPYERDGGEWTILFRTDPNNEMPRGAVLVSSRTQFSETGSGAKTRRVLTERFKDDVRTINDGSGAGGPAQTLAYFYHQDEKG